MNYIEIKLYYDSENNLFTYGNKNVCPNIYKQSNNAYQLKIVTPNYDALLGSMYVNFQKADGTVNQEPYPMVYSGTELVELQDNTEENWHVYSAIIPDDVLTVSSPTHQNTLLIAPEYRYNEEGSNQIFTYQPFTAFCRYSLSNQPVELDDDTFERIIEYVNTVLGLKIDKFDGLMRLSNYVSTFGQDGEPIFSGLTTNNLYIVDVQYANTRKYALNSIYKATSSTQVQLVSKFIVDNKLENQQPTGTIAYLTTEYTQTGEGGEGEPSITYDANCIYVKNNDDYWTKVVYNKTNIDTLLTNLSNDVIHKVDGIMRLSNYVSGYGVDNEPIFEGLTEGSYYLVDTILGTSETYTPLSLYVATSETTLSLINKGVVYYNELIIGAPNGTMIYLTSDYNDRDANCIYINNGTKNEPNWVKLTYSKENINNLLLPIENAISDYSTRIGDLETDNTSNKQRIGDLETDNTSNKQRLTDLESDNTSNKQRITTNEQAISSLQANKLNKNLNDLNITTGIGNNDLIIINKSGTSYKILARELKEKDDHYLGNFVSVSALEQAHPTANEGDYAFVQDTTDPDDTILVMYIWDNIDNEWQRSGSNVYVDNATFQAYQNAIANGTSIVGKARDYDTTGGTIKRAFENVVLENHDYVNNAFGPSSTDRGLYFSNLYYSNGIYYREELDYLYYIESLPIYVEIEGGISGVCYMNNDSAYLPLIRKYNGLYYDNDKNVVNLLELTIEKYTVDDENMSKAYCKVETISCQDRISFGGYYFTTSFRTLSNSAGNVIERLRKCLKSIYTSSTDIYLPFETYNFKLESSNNPRNHFMVARCIGIDKARPDDSYNSYLFVGQDESGNTYHFSFSASASSPTYLYGYYEPRKELFKATYGTTTYDEITTALSNNQLPICVYNDVVYNYAGTETQVYTFKAINGVNNVTKLLVDSSDTWSSSSTILQIKRLTTTIDSSSTDIEYPSSKAVYDALLDKENKLTVYKSPMFRVSFGGLTLYTYETTKNNDAAQTVCANLYAAIVNSLNKYDSQTATDNMVYLPFEIFNFRVGSTTVTRNNTMIARVVSVQNNEYNIIGIDSTYKYYINGIKEDGTSFKCYYANLLPLDNNSWRQIAVDGTVKFGSGTNTPTLNLKSGNNIEISYSTGGNVTFNAKIATITVDLLQVVSADPLEIQLTNEQYNTLLNNKQVIVDVSALGQPTVIWNYQADDSSHLYFGKLSALNTEEVEGNLIEIDKSTLIATYIRFTSGGSSVEANPVGSPSANLNSVDIGGTIYRVKQFNLTDTAYLEDITLQFSDTTNEIIEGVVDIDNQNMVIDITI